jgi:hypothetical protein
MFFRVTAFAGDLGPNWDPHSNRIVWDVDI